MVLYIYVLEKAGKFEILQLRMIRKEFMVSIPCVQKTILCASVIPKAALYTSASGSGRKMTGMKYLPSGYLT